MPLHTSTSGLHESMLIDLHIQCCFFFKFSCSKNKRADVVFMQETFSLWSSMWNGSINFSNGFHNSEWVLVLIAASLEIDVVQVVHDSGGRYIFIDCIIQGLRMILCNAYFPTKR